MVHESDDLRRKSARNASSIKPRSEFVREEGGNTAAIQVAGMGKRPMFIAYHRHLPNAVRPWVRIYPKKEGALGADTDCQLVLRGASQRGVDNVEMTKGHITPYAANSCASSMIASR